VDELPLDGPHDPGLLAELLRLARDLPPHPAPRSREELLRRDPLRFIPAERLSAAAGPAPEPEAGPFVLDAADPAFCGQGWWPAERTASGPLRWSGAAPCATLLLPALGGGRLALTLTVRSPFGIPLDIGGYDVLLDGVPLGFATLANDGVVGTFVAHAIVPPMQAGARLALLLHAAWHGDPASGPGRDARRLGLGLMSLRLERA
jgi:hypothetical protein